jgi:hypothetical protein
MPCDALPSALNGRRPLRTPTATTRCPWFYHLIACAIWRRCILKTGVTQVILSDMSAFLTAEVSSRRCTEHRHCVRQLNQQRITLQTSYIRVPSITFPGNIVPKPGISLSYTAYPCIIIHLPTLSNLVISPKFKHLPWYTVCKIVWALSSLIAVRTAFW